MSKVILSSMTGKETQKDGSCQFNLFYLPANGAKEQFISAAEKLASESGRLTRVGPPVFESAVAGVKHEIGGTWVRSQYQIEEGALLKIYAQHRGGWNKLMKQAQLYFQIREDAPLQSIRMPTLAVAGKSRFSQVDVTGRFDVLTLQEAKSGNPGLVVSPIHERMFLESAVNSLLQFTILEPARSAPVKVSLSVVRSADGTEEVVRIRKRVRSLEF